MLRITDDAAAGADWPPGLPAATRLVRSARVDVALITPVQAPVSLTLDRHVLLFPLTHGRARIDRAGGAAEELRLQAGTAVHAPPRSDVRLSADPPAETIVLAPAADMLAAVGARTGAGPAEPALRSRGDPDPGVHALASELRRALLADSFSAVAYLHGVAEALILRVLCLASEQPLETRPHLGLAPAVLERVLKAIEDRLEDAPSVEELARAAKFSRSHFARAFRKATGLSPSVYIAQRRLCRARDLLVDTNMTIAQIAARTGYSSHGHLTAAFRAALGQTPTQYRTAGRGENPRAGPRSSAS
ncbi:MAG: helix-turn-helix transcriptional regulator [Allosphingosinicella sp.]|uniref:helix-turn-helix transcriptional regulator n=1 Tax=Allosphingosinicella sp. TaxID=2823234 RepID=UPI003949E1AA